MHDKLVKRGQVVCWHGWRYVVLRVRTGRCLCRKVRLFGRESRDTDQQWFPCSSVYVVPA
ncbi:hypothetical protein [Paracidovorax avenae]|uniref:hypothetical protein n=1 Tax=Paracidovorax avenae TaxID=80867 RepID=UPI001AD7ED23|nr:hypothetical protein [Paracidovorax avenae]